eukprot:GHVH01013484.1.p1 GENE.GHVH01013484.1~~GHVH01013484.1.p1  ORF type:complete len:335 (+),score=72.84 GHVH01013484.1:174-1178(+)
MNTNRSGGHQVCNEVHMKLIDKSKSLLTELDKLKMIIEQHEITIKENELKLQEVIEQHENELKLKLQKINEQHEITIKENELKLQEVIEQHENTTKENDEKISQLEIKIQRLEKSTTDDTVENIYDKMFIRRISITSLKERFLKLGLTHDETNKLIDGLRSQNDEMDNDYRCSVNFCLMSNDPSHLRTVLTSLEAEDYKECRTLHEQFVKDRSPFYVDGGDELNWFNRGDSTRNGGRTSVKRIWFPCCMRVGNSPVPSALIKNAIEGGIDTSMIDDLIDKMNELFISSDQRDSIIYCLNSCNPIFYKAAIKFYNMEGAQDSTHTILSMYTKLVK